MDTDEINCLLRSESMFSGCVPADGLPKTSFTSGFFVVNTDKAAEPGEHWCVVGVIEKTGIFFSSFGNPPSEKTVVNFLQRNADVWYLSSKRLQSHNSSTCGLYCVMFIRALGKGLSMQSFLDCFDESDPRTNDVIVQNMLGGCSPPLV